MKKIRDVIRLKSSSTFSDRQIARVLNISRPVVGKYWQGFFNSGLRLEQIQEMADNDLLRLIEKPKIGKSTKYLCKPNSYIRTSWQLGNEAFRLILESQVAERLSERWLY